MKELRIGPQDALPDLEPCFDSLIKFHCGNTPEAPPWRFVKAQMKQESAFNPVAVSPTGPVGLGQFTRLTWEGRRPGKDRRDVFDMTGAMVEEMSHHILWARARGCAGPHVYRFALACYNAGAGNVTKAMQLAANQGAGPFEWGNIPHVMVDIVGAAKVAEVTDYVNKVMAYWASYENPGVTV